MFNAIIDSVQSNGINHIDTASNYRYMKSERTVGAALNFLMNNKNFTRENFFISSKLGFIAEDFDNKIFLKEKIEKLIKEKKITNEDIIDNSYCINPNFLNESFEIIRKNLGIETLDLIYLQNFYEMQKVLNNQNNPSFSSQKEKILLNLSKTFEFLEEKVSQGKLLNYGLATWECFRANPETNFNSYLSLLDVVKIAENTIGKNHHFKFVQMPINIMMPEAWAEKWQSNNKEEKIPLLELAGELELNIISCSPLLQGTLIQIPLSTSALKCSYLGAKHIQFNRSLPYKSLKSL